jgi:hypothetical protein
MHHWFFRYLSSQHIMFIIYNFMHPTAKHASNQKLKCKYTVENIKLNKIIYILRKTNQHHIV